MMNNMGKESTTNAQFVNNEQIAQKLEVKYGAKDWEEFDEL